MKADFKTGLAARQGKLRSMENSALNMKFLSCLVNIFHGFDPWVMAAEPPTLQGSLTFMAYALVSGP